MLSPVDQADGKGFFPPGFQSLVSSFWSYLLKIENNICMAAQSITNSWPGVSPDVLSGYYSGGILCKLPLRSLKIYSRGQSLANHFNIVLTIWKWPIALSTASASAISSVQPTLLSTFEIPYHQISADGSFPSLTEAPSVLFVHIYELIAVYRFIDFFLHLIEARICLSSNSGNEKYIQRST